MNKLYSSDKIYVSQSKIAHAERGVFASVIIKKGELIEECPVIEIPEHDSESINQSMLVTYVYYLGKNKDRLMLALGFGSIYNHSYQPNAKYKEAVNIISFIAIKDIQKDEEITVNYNGENKKNEHPMWFEVTE